MEKEMEKEKNMIIKVIYYLKENIIMGKGGMVKHTSRMKFMN